MEYIRLNENGINIVFGITEDRRLKLLHFSKAEYNEADILKLGPEIRPDERERKKTAIDEIFHPVELKLAGFNSPCEKHGGKHIVSSPGILLKYVSMDDERNDRGRLVTITQEDNEVSHIRCVTSMQFFDNVSVVRMKNTVTNTGCESCCVEALSSFLYFGIQKEGESLSEDKLHFLVPFNGWQKELSVKDVSLNDVGLANTQTGVLKRTSQVFEVTNTGNWSAKKYLPLGYIGNREADTALFFQIEHNGSWHYEIGDQNDHYYVYVSGPTELQSHWSKNLAPGESFESVPAAVGVSEDDYEKALAQLTSYRRLIRRPNEDDEKLPVIFNDYMNCLFGDPDTQKELPLIDAASKVGCEYFVIDAGWYDKGNWWDKVGEWKESRERFPEGIRKLTDHIRSKGMIPGLWLELEVMGIESELAKSLPDDWFFVRHGRRVCDRSRYQLDFRKPAVREHISKVVDRIVNEYGAGYIKLDYNIEPGIGTETGADSFGDGLLGHERAYLAWLDETFKRHPGLVIENCSSGGLRMDYALLSRYSIQSTSDQEDYRNYATIAANHSLGVTPEQAAVWSYPINYRDALGKTEARPEEVIFNMVNALLVRIHQSGHLAELPEESVNLVKDGIRCYKSIRADIKAGLPFLPLGFADNTDMWLCSGLRLEDKAYLAVWKRSMDGKRDNRRLESRQEKGDENAFSIPLKSKGFLKDDLTVRQIYPGEDICASNDSYKSDFELDGNLLTVYFREPVMARLYEIR